MSLELAVSIVAISVMLAGYSVSKLWEAEAKLRERVDALEQERKKL